MKINVVGPVKRNHPFGTEIAFMKGFLRLGHEVAGIDPSETTVPVHVDADFTLIFKTGHQLNPQIRDRINGPKIVYQPDDLRFPHIQELMREMRQYADYALTFDDDGSKELVKPEYGYKSARTLLLTADDELYRPLGLHRDLDFVFVGSLGGPRAHASRRRMIQVLHGAGFNVHFEETYDIQRIVELYNRAKVVVNHATDVGQEFGTGYGYQCRHFEVGMTKTCLLSNRTIGKPTPRQSAECELDGWWDYESERQLVEAARMLMERPSFREELAQDLYDDIRRRHMPEHRAQQVIDFVETL